MKASIQTFHVENVEINFFFGYDYLPIIDVNGKDYQCIQQLFNECPLLFEKNCLDRTAQIINFLSKGLEYQLIENIDAFKEDYCERQDSTSLNMLNHVEEHIHDCENDYDLSSMHPPRLMGQNLVFFTKQEQTGVPYKVTFNYSNLSRASEIIYEVLPTF